MRRRSSSLLTIRSIRFADSVIVTLTRHALILALAIVAWGMIGGSSPSFAQGVEYTENKADQALRSSARIDPSTLGMSIAIPLASYPGRGGANLPVTLYYSSKLWRIDYRNYFCANTPSPITETQAEYAEHSAASWTSGLGVPWIKYTGQGQLYDSEGKRYDEGLSGCSEQGSLFNRIV